MGGGYTGDQREHTNILNKITVGLNIIGTIWDNVSMQHNKINNKRSSWFKTFEGRNVT